MEKCLKADFGNLFNKQFKTDEELNFWKKRIWEKFQGMHPPDILDGYDVIVEQKPSHLPTIPELLDATLKSKKKRINDEKNTEESNRISLMPPRPEMTDTMDKKNPRMIRTMMADSSGKMGKKEAEEERKERLIRLEEKRMANEQLIKAISQSGRSLVFHESHKCAVDWCMEIGTVSHSTNGTGSWYCGLHFRERG